MDRFIDNTIITSFAILRHLKSNMDRFIELYFSSIILLKLYLKSNMDRFIDRSCMAL